MYREMYKKGFAEIYCDVWPCDRECGKFHKPFLNTTKLRERNAKFKNGDPDLKEKERERDKGIFEEIMEAAARKNSVEFIQPTLPPLPEEFRHMTLSSTRAKPQITKYADTTTIYFDNPVWDDAKFRQELLADSDEERYSAGLSEPPYIYEDEDSLENLLRVTKHEITSNPVFHLRSDETILTSDDEDEFNYLDPKNGPSRSGPSTSRRRLPPREPSL